MLLISHWAKVLLWPVRSYMSCHSPKVITLPLWPSPPLLSLLFTVLQPPWPLAFACILLSDALTWGCFLFGVLSHQVATGSMAHLFKGPIQMSPCHLKCYLLTSIPLSWFLSLLYFYAWHLASSDLLYIICIVNSMRTKILVCWVFFSTAVSPLPSRTVPGIA